MVTFTDDENVLSHIGIARKSGRYPWGSGKDPFQRAVGFDKFYNEMTAAGHSHAKIAELLSTPEHPLSSTDIRAARARSTELIRTQNINTAVRLRDERKMSTSAIAERMLGDKSKESTVRGWLKASEDSKKATLDSIMGTLKAELESKPYLDVGAGTGLYMGVSATKLNTALAALRDEGYAVHNVFNPQVTTGKNTQYKILTKGDVPTREVYQALQAGKLQNVAAYLDTDTGKMIRSTAEPVSVKSSRIDVRYGSEGGAKMDGVIELRRGVEDLSLGDNKYAQVRIAVDGTHYLKGMAIYADDLPKGVDIRFNTNKERDEGKLGVMKPLKDDPANRFGATTLPVRVYKDKNGKEKSSALNIVNEEGKWDNWSKSLASQMLSKQSVALASRQLKVTQDKKIADLAEINRLTNPVVKQRLLKEYADSADAAAVHLKAAALDRQATKVLLPMNSMRPNEIFAPDFDTGEKVVLVRYPHGGTFEIPQLTVNNNNPTAKRIMGGALDAVGIHSSVAEKLSGADFDGDTVLVIPNNDGRIKSRDSLAALKDFDAKRLYKIPDEDTTTPRMTKKNTQTEMGKITNLINDMTLKGANDDEIARAVKHSMVVIDAEKHGLNYKQSEADNRIKDLKKRYQGAANSGASTIISRASSDARIPERRLARSTEGGPIDPKTGKLNYVNTDRTYVDKNGVVKPYITKGTKMEFATDAHKLTSKYDSKGNLSGVDAQPMERVYADHANRMKALADQARKDMVNTKVELGTSKAAQAVYAKEVESLKAKLKVAQRNAPLERQAQQLAGALAKSRIESRSDLDKDDIKKIKNQSLVDARIRTGAGRKRIGGSEDNPLTDREWEAIQARAISPSMLRDILNNADMERVKTLATPRPRTSLTPGQLSRIESLRASGKSLTDIATALGIPRSTVSDNLQR